MKNFSFTKNSKIFFSITAAMLVLGILSFVFIGFNWDVDFAGGTELVYKIGTVDKTMTDNIEAKVKEIIGNDRFSSIMSSGDAKDEIIIRTNEITSEEREAIFESVKEDYPEVELRSANNVSAAVSGDLRRAAVVSTGVAVILMLLYITIRFQFSSAAAAVVCLVHDVFITIFAYSVFQIPVNSNVIAVLLTILGYSINATIIIFDRVRENNKLMQKANFAEKVDASIKSTLRRSINTTLTTLFTIGMIYILGVTSIKNFALPLIIGILAGLYSSVCLAGPLWNVFKKKNSKVR